MDEAYFKNYSPGEKPKPYSESWREYTAPPREVVTWFGTYVEEGSPLRSFLDIGAADGSFIRRIRKLEPHCTVRGLEIYHEVVRRYTNTVPADITECPLEQLQCPEDITSCVEAVSSGQGTTYSSCPWIVSGDSFVLKGEAINTKWDMAYFNGIAYLTLPEIVRFLTNAFKRVKSLALGVTFLPDAVQRGGKYYEQTLLVYSDWLDVFEYAECKVIASPLRNYFILVREDEEFPVKLSPTPWLFRQVEHKSTTLLFDKGRMRLETEGNGEWYVHGEYTASDLLGLSNFLPSLNVKWCLAPHVEEDVTFIPGWSIRQSDGAAYFTHSVDGFAYNRCQSLPIVTY